MVENSNNSDGPSSLLTSETNRSSKVSFIKDDFMKDKLLSWWRSLDKNRGERAELQRCNTLMDVYLCSSFHNLRHSLMTENLIPNSTKLATVAAVVVHVREYDANRSFAAQLAFSIKKDKKSTEAPMNELRFRRLLSITEREKIIFALIRAVRLLNGKCNILSLADIAYWWNDSVKKGMAFDYYDNQKS